MSVLGKKVETAKRYGRFGRSCRVCKLYFLTSDQNDYVCPWCKKAEKGVSLGDAAYNSGEITMDTQMLVQEEV